MSEASEIRTAVIVEDDEDIQGLIASVLGQAGFTVHTASTGLAGVELVRETDPMVVTLDLSLPDIDGFEVARRVRTFSSTYIVMLTARDEEIDTLLGLEAGADDYLTKPFRPRELRARTEALLRRPRAIRLPGMASGPSAPTAYTPSVPAEAATPGWPGVRRDGVLAHNALVLDTPARLAELDGEPVHLTKSEYLIIEALLEAPHRVLAKPELVRRLWGEDYITGAAVSEADTRTVEVHVANLRRKLGDDAAAPRFIETVRGVGYRLTPAR
ncbi:MAG: response regulator transcription factor [Georgenia sp.]